jgi:hypothetical protein
MNNVFKTTRGMSFSFRLFSSLADLPKEQPPKGFEWRDDLSKNTKDFSDVLIDAVKDKIKKDYSKQIEDFKSNIVCTLFKPIISTRGFFWIKDGLILHWAGEPCEDKRPLSLLSLERKPLETLVKFFSSIDKLGEYCIYPVYSPEEDVFEPYPKYLEYAISHMPRKDKIQDLVYQGLSTFENRNYAYCINTIGLAFEEQLTQIYETLFRNKCPPGLTIGALLEVINQEVKEKNPCKESKLQTYTNDFGSMYDKINSAIEKSRELKLNNNEMLTILREIVTLIKENGANIIAQMRPIDNKNNSNSYSIFPADIIECMSELLRLRNVISHRSRTSVGRFEATKALYDVTAFTAWWRDEKQLIDWADTADDIIHKIAIRNSVGAEGGVRGGTL